MKSAFFFSLLTLLMGSLLLAQSTRDQLADQTKGLPVAQVRQMGMPQDPLPVRPGFVPTQSGIGFYPAEVRRQTSQAVSFSPAADYSTVGFAPYAVAIADVNGDGAPDMIVANACTGTTNGVDCATNYGSVVVLLGNGDGTFNPAVTYVSGGYSSLGVAVGDVNGDGKLDIVLINSYAVINGTVSDSESSVSVLLGNGDGTFKPSVSYVSGPGGSKLVVIADVNGDGKPDLVTASVYGNSVCGEGGVNVLLGNGDGTFKPAVTCLSGGYYPYAIAVADLNDDGKPDVIVVNREEYETGGGQGWVTVLLGNGDGTFQTPQTGVGYASGGLGGESLAVADVSGDGKPDVIVGNQCTAFNNSSSCAEPLVGVIGVLLGNGDGTFQTAAPYSLGGYVADSVDVADMNGDGIPDIVAASACNLDCSAGWVNVLLGIGDGTFQTQGPQSITVNSTSGTAPSTSTSITVLKKTATSIRVTSVNPASEAYSQDAPVAITAVLFWTGTGPAPTASDVAIGGNGSGTYGTTTCGAPSGTSITCTNTYAPSPSDAPGSYTEAATFSGDSNYTGSSSTQSNNFTITDATSTTSVTSNANPSTSGQSVSCPGDHQW